MSKAPASASKSATESAVHHGVDHSQELGHGNSPAAWTCVIVMLVGALVCSIAAATGVTGSSAEVRVTAFPAIAVVVGVLLALGALLIIPAGRYWKSRTKYDARTTGTAAAAGPVDEIDSWDRLSRGDDPT